jgi:hypothetical protein
MAIGIGIDDAAIGIRFGLAIGAAVEASIKRK